MQNADTDAAALAEHDAVAFAVADRDAGRGRDADARPLADAVAYADPDAAADDNQARPDARRPSTAACSTAARSTCRRRPTRRLRGRPGVGQVAVQVVVDERGNIISARAISGHPLLRQAAENAARAVQNAARAAQSERPHPLQFPEQLKVGECRRDGLARVDDAPALAVDLVMRQAFGGRDEDPFDFCGVSDGFASSICATTDETIGAENDVPSTYL